MSDAMKTALIFLAYFPLAMLQGFVLMTLWGWYVTPIFGVATPSLVLCIGFGIFVFALRPRASSDPDIDVGKFIFTVVFWSLWTLAIGWFWHFFV